MKEPRWLAPRTIIDIHKEQLVLFGGPAGIRDQGAMESALTRPINRWHYGCEDIAELAAAYGFGLARNHAFVDGNKRTAFAAIMVFLRLNGIDFRPSTPEATATMLDLAAGEIGEEELARWIADVIARGEKKE